MYKHFLTISLFFLSALSLSAQIVFAGHVNAGHTSGDPVPVPDWPVSIIDPSGAVIEVVFTLEDGLFFWFGDEFEQVDGQAWAVSTQDPCTFGAVGQNIILEEGTQIYEANLTICHDSNPPGGGDVCQAFLGSSVDFNAPEPYTVEFFNLSSVSQATSQVWNFGDGNSSTEENPIHVYDEPGLYEVSLTITGDSCSSTANASLALEFDCNCDAQPIDPVCFYFDLANDIVVFNNLCEAECVGLTEDQVYECDPVGDVQCVAFSQFIASPGDLEVDFLVETFYEEPIDSVSWDFGDGNTGTGISTSHTYDALNVYNVTVTTYNFGLGCVASQTFTVDIRENGGAPLFCESLFFFYQLNPEDLMSFEFLALEFFLADEYFWDFGDGNSATGVETSHVYTEPGTYIVTLTTAAGEDCTSTYSSVIEVSENNFYGSESCRTVMLPIMNPTDSTMNTVEIIPFFLTSDLQGPTALDTILVSWNFGDGNTSTELQPTHTYAEAGVYTATLTITDGLDCESTVAVIINLETGQFSAQPGYTVLSNTRETRTLEELTVFPNPGNGFYAVEWAASEPTPTLDWQLMSTTGRIIRSGTTEASQRFDLDISDQPNGTYLLRLESERGVSTRRLVKTF